MKLKPIEIFSGTGGVGKTTLATARALALSKAGRKVLLMTIDPAKRLKQILGMDEAEAGAVKTIESSALEAGEVQSSVFDALLIDPSVTARRLFGQNGMQKDFDNHILKILVRPYGGMNEIMAVIEVQHHLASESYETIILDTPPGHHFVDFLFSLEKIDRFFDQAFVDVFEYLQTKERSTTSRKIVSLIVQTGIKKLLSYLKKVTGSDFVDDFLEAITSVYRNKKAFVSALEFRENLKDKNFGHWFLVTSVEQQNFFQAEKIKAEAKNFTDMDAKLVVNKCLKSYLEAWEVDGENKVLMEFKKSLCEKEDRLERLAGQHFEHVWHFPEVLAGDPREQVCQLARYWESKR